MHALCVLQPVVPTWIDDPGAANLSGMNITGGVTECTVSIL